MGAGPLGGRKSSCIPLHLEWHMYLTVHIRNSWMLSGSIRNIPSIFLFSPGQEDTKSSHKNIEQTLDFHTERRERQV